MSFHAPSEHIIEGNRFNMVFLLNSNNNKYVRKFNLLVKMLLKMGNF